MVPPALTYRARLRTEGFALAACGAVGSVVVLAVGEDPTYGLTSTVVQLIVVAVALALLGPRSVRTAMARSQPEEVRPATGEPTPLWHLPLVVAVLTVPLAAVGAWDAGLRVTGGCVLVGLAQAVLLSGVVAADERRTGRTYARAPGSRILRGTVLAYAQARA